MPISILAILFASAYFVTTPTFNHDYKQLTERVEIGLKYTNPEKTVIFVHPYVENPNRSNLTLRHHQNFIKICVLDKNGNVLENAVTVEQMEDEDTKLLQTTLKPGQKEKKYLLL